MLTMLRQTFHCGYNHSSMVQTCPSAVQNTKQTTSFL